MEIVRAEKLCFGYDGVPVLKNLSFTVEKGEFWGVIGANGTGKSTLFRLIMGILSPESGGITLFGKDIGKFREFNRISYVAQKSAVLSGGFPATALETVLSGLAGRLGVMRRSGREEREYALYCLDTVGASDYSRKLLGELSGGQLQRVIIARALAAKPELMLLDEPTIGIDTRSVEDICCLLARLNKEHGLTIAMITHDLVSVLSHAGKVLVFDDEGGADMVDNTDGAASGLLAREIPRHGRNG